MNCKKSVELLVKNINKTCENIHTLSSETEELKVDKVIKDEETHNYKVLLRKLLLNLKVVQDSHREMCIDYKESLKNRSNYIKTINEQKIEVDKIQKHVNILRKILQSHKTERQQLTKEASYITNNIVKLKKEINNLIESSVIEQQRKQIHKEEMTILSKELQDLKEQKERLLDQIEIKLKPRSIDSVNTENQLNKKGIATSIDGITSLLEKKVIENKSSSVILNSAKEVIRVISQNEFSSLKWSLKISEGKSKYGAKIRFKNMNTQYSDLKLSLKPIINTLSIKFRNNGLDIKTRIKTSPGEVVDEMEITFIVNKTLHKQPAIRA
jgi:chromosome segregation ATPase